MGYKRKALGDKKIYILSLLGVFAICAVVGGALIKNMDKPTENKNDKVLVKSEEDANSVGINNSKPIELPTQEETKVTEGNTKKNADDNTGVDKNDANKGGAEGEDKKADNRQKGEKQTTANNSSQLAQAGAAGSNVSGLTFSKKSTFVWPVSGNVIIDFDMESVVYHPTLDVYKCSDSLCIQSAEGTAVYAGAAATVLEIGNNSEIGNFVRMNLGNGYEVTYGSLKDIQVSSGLTIKTGELIGYVDAPTKYYSLEGPNLYIKMTENGTPVDPLEHLNYE